LITNSDPKAQFQVGREARKDGLEILANYHSHPETPARPSLEDIRLAFDPNISYVIVSLAAEMPDIKSFSIKNWFNQSPHTSFVVYRIPV
jgi:proteasome lid subunit RPN8/RPN11